MSAAMTHCAPMSLLADVSTLTTKIQLLGIFNPPLSTLVPTPTLHIHQARVVKLLKTQLEGHIMETRNGS